MMTMNELLWDAWTSGMGVHIQYPWECDCGFHGKFNKVMDELMMRTLRWPASIEIR